MLKLSIQKLQEKSAKKTACLVHHENRNFNLACHSWDAIYTKCVAVHLMCYGAVIKVVWQKSIPRNIYASMTSKFLVLGIFEQPVLYITIYIQLLFYPKHSCLFQFQINATAY